MSGDAATDYARERQLIEKLEFRIASANSSDKLQAILQKFLPALVLKLATQDVQNRNLTIKVCQYINQRLKIDASLQVPVEGLSKTYNASDNAFVKQFCLMFMQHGFHRLKPEDAISSLPQMISASLNADSSNANDTKMLSFIIGLLLETLPHWKLPEPGTKDDSELAAKFALSESQRRSLANYLSQFLLFDPKETSVSDVTEDVRAIFERAFSNRSRIVPGVARFVFTSIFQDEDRFVPATILSVDANAEASKRADVMFKQCTFDLESDLLVDAAFTMLEFPRTRLQTRVLILLSRSRKSTTRVPRIVSLIELQLANTAMNLEAIKLRAAMFTYLIWAVRINKDIANVAENLLATLKDFIELQGWPRMNDESLPAANLRAQTYESIGLLAASLKHRGAATRPVSLLNLVTWLFASLRCDVTSNVRHSIEEALSRLMNAVTITDSAEADQYRALLLWNVLATEGESDPTYYLPTRVSAQYPAVRFTNKLFDFSDISARSIDIVALGSDRKETVEEARRGLDPYWHASSSRVSGNSTSIELPSYIKFVWPTFRGGQLRVDSSVVTALPSRVGALSFAQNLLVAEAWQGSDLGLTFDAGWQDTVKANLRGSSEARELLRARLTRDVALTSELLQVALNGMREGSIRCADFVYDTLALASNELVDSLAQQGLSACNDVIQNARVQTQAARAFGIMMSLSEQWEAVVGSELEQCNGWKEVVGQPLLRMNGSLLKAGNVLSRALLRGKNCSAETIASALQLCKDIVESNVDKGTRQNAYLIAGQIALALPDVNEMHTLPFLSQKTMLSDAKKENETAVWSMGRILNCSIAQKTAEERAKAWDELFELHEVRKVEFHFALGEAFVVAALGWRSSSTMTEFDIDGDQPVRRCHRELFTELLDTILEKAQSTKPAMRKASGIWLLSLIQFCKEGDLLQPRLQACQSAFTRLLSDRDEVVQEAGSRGLALVYEKGNKALREDLVRNLVQSFTGGAKMSGTVSEDTQLFEAGALPTEDGQSVTTYKDIVSLAQEMGDPSLVYRFMSLASNNAVWSSRAAFGRFGLSGVLADSNYLKENKKFYPKLFRYRFDPNPNVQRSMNDIWKALVKDSNATIDENFDLIMEDLLKSILSGKEWRAREASCAAIADLVQGRDMEKFEKYLDEIWRKAFKVRDDVKETVRIAAMKLCQTLTGMLIRNLEVGEGNSKRATIMVDHALPFLIEQMHTGAAKDAQHYAIKTLLDLVKEAPMKMLRGFAPMILQTLINSLSSFEPESVNYVHLNADKYGLTTNKIDEMRVSGISTSPFMDAIDRCLESVCTVTAASATDQAEADAAALADAMKRLETCFKSTIGLPSRVSLSRVIVTLTVRYHAVFRPYADKFARLTRRNILDRNATISQSFTMALAYLLRIASDKEVRQTVQYAQKLYFASEELTHRAVAGEIIQAIGKVSTDVFSKFASLFLPFAFVGRQDSDPDARERFDNAWKDNIGGPRALNLYLREIVELVSTHIKSNLWPIRHACCLAISDLIKSTEGGYQYQIEEARLIYPLLEESLSGKTWEGKEKVVSVLPVFVKKARAIWTEITPKVKVIALREAKRTNPQYRAHAISALGGLAAERLDLDFAPDVVPLLANVVANVTDPDKMDVDSKEPASEASSGVADETCCSAVKCLFAVLRAGSTNEVLEQAMTIINVSRKQNSRSIEMTFCDSAAKFCATVFDKNKGEEEAGSGSAVGDRVSTHFSSAYQAFLDALVLALESTDLTSYASDPEKLRLSRITMADNLAKITILSDPTRGALARILTGWLQQERSGANRVLIEEALQRNTSLLS